jgi:hypothetical protein
MKTVERGHLAEVINAINVTRLSPSAPIMLHVMNVDLKKKRNQHLFPFLLSQDKAFRAPDRIPQQRWVP